MRTAEPDDGRPAGSGGGTPSAPTIGRRRVLGLLAGATLTSVVGACRGEGPARSGAAGTGTTSTTAPPIARAADVVVTVDADARFQRIDGFGCTARLFDDPHLTETFDPGTGRSKVVVPPAEQQAVLRALFEELGLTRLRMATADHVQSVRGGPYDFSWKLNDGFIDLAAAVKRLGPVTHTLSPIKLEAWMSEDDPDGYVEWALAILRRWGDRGQPVPYYALMNEPGNLRGPRSPAFHREVIRRLGPKLEAAGLPTKIVLPDDLNALEAAFRIREVMADPDAARYVHAFAYHLYPSREGADEVRALGRRYGRPVWMTEFYVQDGFEWARLLHQLLVEDEVAAVDYLWGFFGQWEARQATQLIVIRHDDDGTYRGFDRTPHFFFTGQYSRFVRPGAVRLGASSPSAEVLASAFAGGSTTAVVLTNAGATPVAVDVVVTGAGGPAGGSARRVTATRSTATEGWVDAEAVLRPAAPAPTVAVELPPRSVTTAVLA